MKFLIAFFLIFFALNIKAQQVIDKLNVKALKLPSESVSRALMLDSSGNVKSSSTVSDTELSYLDGLSASLTSLLGDKLSTTGNESASGTKTFTGKLVTSTTSNGSIPCPVMTQGQRDAIVSPVEGDCIYNSSSDKTNVYTGSAWIVVGSGVGGINYITNSDIELDTTGFAVYADAASVNPVDGTGGSPASTISRTTSSPLRDTAELSFVKSAANRQGEGFSFDFTIANADKNQLLGIEFEYEVTSGTYASNDVGIYIYDVTNATLINPIVSDLPGTTGQAKFVSQFQSTSSTSYRLIAHVKTTSTNAYTLSFDTFKVSPSQSFVGTIVTDWQSYTPTLVGFGTVSQLSAFYRRVGSSLELNVFFVTGTTTATTASFSLPAGLTVSSIYGVNRYMAGTLISGANGAGSFSVLVNGGQTTLNFGVQNVSNAGFTPAGGSTISAGVNNIAFTALVPIQGWTAANSATQGFGVTPSFRSVLSTDQLISSTSPTKVTFNTVAHDTTGSFDTTNNRYVIPETGLYTINSQIIVVSVTANDALALQLYINGSINSFSQIVNPNANYAITYVNTIKLNKGDYIEIYADSSGDTSYSVEGTATGRSWFTATRVDKNMFGMNQVVAATYTTNAGQAIPFNTVTTIVFEDKVVDTHNAMNTSTGVYTIPVDGTYTIDSDYMFAGNSNWNGTESAISSLWVNGSQVVEKENFLYATVTGTPPISPGSFSYTANFSAGTTIEVKAYQNGVAGTLSLRASSLYNRVRIIKEN